MGVSIQKISLIERTRFNTVCDVTASINLPLSHFNHTVLSTRRSLDADHPDGDPQAYLISDDFTHTPSYHLSSIPPIAIIISPNRVRRAAFLHSV